MPVILKPFDYVRWLDTTDIERPAVDLLRPYAAGLMTAHAVDPPVGNLRNKEIRAYIKSARTREAGYRNIEETTLGLANIVVESENHI